MNMLIAFLLCVSAVTAVPTAKVITPEETTAYRYHERIGIPRAQEIKAYEEEILKDPSKIIAGSAAAAGQIPFQAGLLISLVGTSGQSVCGAVLITNNRLLTAAHCWFDGAYQAFQFQVILGTTLFFSGGTRITTSRVETHYEWNPSRITSDIAIIGLDQNVATSNTIRPVTLPRNFANENFVGWNSTVSGFGKTSDAQSGISSSTFLSFVDMTVITNAVCRNSFGSSIIESTLCTSGTNRKSACSGDSGGPLTVVSGGETVLIGLVSFGSGWGCEWGFPNAFARVTAFLSWIEPRL